MKEKNTIIASVLLFSCVFISFASDGLENADQSIMHEEDVIIIDNEYKNFELFLKDLVEGGQEEGKENILPAALIRCYEQLSKKQSIKKEDLQEALPYLFECVEGYCQHMGMEFPRAISAFMDLGHGCSLHRVIALLERLLSEVKVCCAHVNINVTDIFALLEKEFNGTFSALEEVIFDVEGTFSLLVDIRNTLTECCANITNNFNGTFSALDAGFDGTFTMLNEILMTMTLSINGTFSMIQDIKNTLTACCEAAQNDFEQTWTILAALHPTSSLTINFFGGFQETWTMLAAGFNGTFSDLNTCCTTINNEFQETWTILSAGFNGTFSSLNMLPSFDCPGTFSTLAEIKDMTVTDFNGTWSMLATGFGGTFSLLAAINPLEVSIVGFQGTFSALDACCRNITSEFQQTWTITGAGFNGTFSSLADLKSKILTTSSIGISTAFTALAAGFNGTFSSLAEVKNILAKDFNDTFTRLDAISMCFATSLTAGGNITNSGSYCLANDITGSFTITANNVVLDLSNHVISNGGIFVLTGTYRTVKNGRLDNSNTGIVLTANTDTTLSDLTITNATLTPAITFTGIHFDNVVNNIVIENCKTGFASTNDNNLQIKQMTIRSATSSAMTFTNSTNLQVYDVSVLNGNADGVDLTNPVNANFSNIILYNTVGFGFITFGSTQHCNFKNTQITVSQIQSGISLANPTNCLIKECIIQGFDSSSQLVQAISMNSGNYNTLESCIVRNITASSVSLTGFLLTCSNTILSNCIAQSLAASVGSSISGFLSNGIDDSYYNCYVINQSIPSSPAILEGFSATARQLTSASNIDYFNCSVVNSPGLAFFPTQPRSSFYNCTAVLGGGSIFAAFTAASTFQNKMLCKNCVATKNNGLGFGVSTGNGTTVGAVFYKCQSAGNVADGFRWGEAFGGSSDIYAFDQCTSIGNGNTGFEILGPVASVVYHCFSALNSVHNYLGPISTQSSSVTNPLAGSNPFWILA